MNRTSLIIAISLALQATDGFGYSYQAQTGALSYTFFNLSPNQWTLTPYGGGVNPQGQPGSFAVTQGWGNVDGSVGVFNPVNISGGSCSNPSTQVQGNTIWYNETPGPIAAPSGAITLSAGTSISKPVVKYSNQTSPTYNAPAIADSWVLSGNGNNIVMANMASAPNMFISNWPSTTSDYPYCASQTSLYYNANINPPQPNSLINGSWSNPLGAGFVPQTMNLNVSNTSPGYVATGGLWSGVNNPNPGNLALNSLNLSMYPINLSNYVQSPVVNKGISQTAAPIYGGHFTLAVGDPFLVSSYAAKILWYIVTNNGYAFSNSSLSTTDLSTLTNLVAPPSGNAVFASGSYSAKYAQWLLASPGLAQSAISTMNTAASKPITHESVWGKITNAVLQLATNVAIASIGLTAGPEADIGLEAILDANEGSLETLKGEAGPSVTDAITAYFTTTTSLQAPVTQTAPPVINSTYSSSNLLGMLLANSFVQAEINNAEGLGNQSGFALWSNDSINVDNLCQTSSVNVTANLISGPCYTTNSGGTMTNTTVATGSQSASTQSYAVSVHSPPLFLGSAAILAAISAGETPTLPGG